MKKTLLAIVFACLFMVPAIIRAADIAGVYENRSAVVTLTKEDSAWLMECTSDEPDWVILSKEKKNIPDPFDPTKNCVPQKKITSNVYSIKIDPKVKLECEIIPPDTMLVIYYPDAKSLDIRPNMDMSFDGKPKIIVYKAPLYADDCKKLAEPFKKIK